MKTKQQLIETIRTLDLDPELKEKLLFMVNSIDGDIVDDDSLRDIKSYLLEEEGRALDDAAAELGIDVVNDPDIKAVESVYETEVALIRSAYASDMQELDQELNKLEVAQVDLMAADDAVQIDAITLSLKA